MDRDDLIKNFVCIIIGITIGGLIVAFLQHDREIPRDGLFMLVDHHDRVVLRIARDGEVSIYGSKEDIRLSMEEWIASINKQLAGKGGQQQIVNDDQKVKATTQDNGSIRIEPVTLPPVRLKE